MSRARDTGAVHGVFSVESTRGLSLEKRISTSNQPQHLVFPGCGVNFWWEAGTISALREEFDLQDSKFSMYGASAGSISSVLAACGVDLKNAMRVALSPTKGHTHADRIEIWLQEILPENCHKLCSNKVNISITTIHWSFIPLHRKVISVFSSKQDVIDCCLTSCHIPYFVRWAFLASLPRRTLCRWLVPVLFALHSLGPTRTRVERQTKSTDVFLSERQGTVEAQFRVSESPRCVIYVGDVRAGI
jgi:hypothetical protein